VVLTLTRASFFNVKHEHNWLNNKKNMYEQELSIENHKRINITETSSLAATSIYSHPKVMRRGLTGASTDAQRWTHGVDQESIAKKKNLTFNFIIK
jgi:hypothetical protein